MSPSLAERTREAVRDRPFLYEALRAGVVNYSAAARYLDVGDRDAVAAALRRYAGELPARDQSTPPAGDARVTMERGFGEGNPAEALLVAGETALVPDDGALTGILATGDVSPAHLREALGRCATAGVSVEAAAVAGGSLRVVVPEREGPDALRRVEGVI